MQGAQRDAKLAGDLAQRRPLGEQAFRLPHVDACLRSAESDALALGAKPNKGT